VQIQRGFGVLHCICSFVVTEHNQQSDAAGDGASVTNTPSRNNQILKTLFLCLCQQQACKTTEVEV
jgi:hypothetical protein